MPPNKRDPRRPLTLAVRSTRLLGIVLILFSTIIIVSVAILTRGLGAGTFEISATALVLGVFYLGPGIMYLLCAIFMNRRRRWAIIVAIVMASIHLAMMLFSGAVLLLSISIPRQSSPRMPWEILIVFAIIALFAAAFAQLLYHLSKSFAAIREAPIDGQRGFTPILAPRESPQENQS